MKKLQEYPFFLSLFTVAFLPTYLIRFEIGWVRMNMLDILLCISILSFFLIGKRKSKTSKKEDGKKNQKKVFWLGVFFLFFGLFLSAIAGGLDAQALGIIKSWFVLPFLFAFVLHKYIWERDKRTLLFSAYGIGVLGSILFSWYRGFFLEGFTYDGRLVGWYDSPNQFAMFIAPFFLFLWIQIRWRISSQSFIFPLWLLYILLISIGTTLILTQSYGAFLSLGGAIILLEILREGSWKRKLLYVFVGFCVFIGGMWFFGGDKGEAVRTFDERSSLVSREMIWRSALHIGKDYWFFGIGPGNFQEYYLLYQQYYPPYLEWAVPQPHNIYLAFWLQTGFVGLLGFLLIIGSIFFSFMCWFQEKKKMSAQENTHFLFLYAFFLLTSLWGLIDTPYWRNDLAVLFWIGIFLSIKDSQR